MMTQLLLKWNGYVLELKPGELADMFISLQMAVRENTSCKHGSFNT